MQLIRPKFTTSVAVIVYRTLTHGRYCREKPQTGPLSLQHGAPISEFTLIREQLGLKFDQ